MTRTLVTGGTGFTGRHLVRSLLADGHHVRVLTRSAAGARDRLPATVDLFEGDVADPAIMSNLVRDREMVYHLAAAFNEAGIPDRRYRETHVEGTRNLLEAARAEGVRRFVHCSTVGVRKHIEDPPADENMSHAPGDIYQETKSEGEKLALSFQRRHDFPLAVIRPAPIYGPGDLRLLKLFRMIDRGVFVMLGRGEVRFHMVYVDDLVRGFRLAAEKEEARGEVFIIAGEEAPTLNDLARRIAEVLDVPAPRFRLPIWPFYAAGYVCEKICIPLGIEPPIYRRRVGFFMNHREFTIEKARRVLGYEPAVGLNEGLRRTVDWYRAEGHLEGEPAAEAPPPGSPARGEA